MRLLLLFVLFLFFVSACDLAGEATSRGLYKEDPASKVPKCDANEAVQLVFDMVGEGASDTKIMKTLDKMGCSELNEGVKVKEVRRR